MSPEYAIALFGLFIGLCGAVALVWAFTHRQLQAGDQAMYEAVADDEPDYTTSAVVNPRQLPARSRWLFVLAFGAVFALIGWLIVLTVQTSSHVPPPPPARRQPSSE